MAIKVNQIVPKMYTLSALSKKKKISKGDGGFISDRLINRNK